MAANQGHAIAQEALGLLYERGLGVPQSYSQAAKLYKRYFQLETDLYRFYKLAADQGLAAAQTSLGILYEKGRGVTLDLSQAAKYVRHRFTLNN